MDLGPSEAARHIDLPPETVAAGQARAFVRDTLTAWGYDNVTDEVALAVSELVTNAVVHAHSPASVTLLDREGTVQVRVRDTAPAPPRVIVAAETDTGGRGLMMVEALSDHWGVEPAPPGKIIWLDISDH